MSVISQTDFDLWFSDPITKSYKLALVDRIGQVKELLATTAGLDSNEDNFRRGYVQALLDALDFRLDDLQEAENVN